MTIVADAGPLLHLFWVGASTWALPPQRIDVVNNVWEEVAAHAPKALQESRLYRVTSKISLSQDIVQWDLDLGEQTALSYALTQNGEKDVLVLCDERQARQVCANLSLPIVGSIGLIVEAFRAGRVSLAIASEALWNLPSIGRLHIRLQLIEQAVVELERLHLEE